MTMLSLRPAVRSIRIGLRRRLYHELSFRETGEPKDVLQYLAAPATAASSQLAPPNNSTADGSVRVQMHFAPWNPADENTVQGKYPSPYSSHEELKSSLSSATTIQNLRQSRYFPEQIVAGSEGYGRIVETTTTSGPKNKVNEGDWVTFAFPGLGTLRSDLWLPPEAVLPIRRGEELFEATTIGATAASAASTLFQCGGTALRMLTDFVKLEPGDVVLQNAGNSSVGFLVSQLAKRIEPHVHVVSMVRRGNKTPEAMKALKDHLVTAGQVDLVLVEDDLFGNRDAIRSAKSQLQQLGTSSSSRPPVLALNAVGGESSSVLLQLIGPGGIHVTYGGMSKQPVSIATSHLIFKDIQVRGYWQSRWMIQHQDNLATKIAMVDDLVAAVLDDKLALPPVKVFGLGDSQAAFQFAAKQTEAGIRSKTVFDCRQSE